MTENDASALISPDGSSKLMTEAVLHDAPGGAGSPKSRRARLYRRHSTIGYLSPVELKNRRSPLRYIARISALRRISARIEAEILLVGVNWAPLREYQN